MISPALSIALLICSSSGFSDCRHHRAVEECSTCRDDHDEVQKQIGRLHESGWMGRKKAARTLRRYDWKEYPEAAEALAVAVMNDDCGFVRKEAVESLGSMRPCLAIAHEAVSNAAGRDSSLLTRHAAKKALKSLSKACVDDCSLCGVEHIGPGPEVGRIPADELDLLVPPTTIRTLPPIESRVDPLPPTSLDLPSAPPLSSPFDPSPSLPAPSLPATPPAILNDAPMLESPLSSGRWSQPIPMEEPPAWWVPMGRMPGWTKGPNLAGALSRD